MSDSEESVMSFDIPEGNGFSESIIQLLNQKLPENKKDPVFSKSKALEKKLDEKWEYKAKLEIKKEKKIKEELNHVIPNTSNLENEKKLKKTATKGIVKLFNAINSQNSLTKSNDKDIKSNLFFKDLGPALSRSKVLEMLKRNK